AIYGPFGFDIGMLLGNFLLAYFAQSGHEATPGAREEYRRWLLGIVVDTWNRFAAEFGRLWRTERTGILYESALFQEDPLASEQALQSVLAGIWRDTLGFAGVEMHRRILGLAHVEDLEAIPDLACRVVAERRALALGRQMAVLRGTLHSPAQVCALAENIEIGDLS
ncbi:MAG: S-methyl-5-thioribose kinase, partial [Paracoccaceae bacterium]